MPESKGRKTEAYIPPPPKKVTKPPRILNWVGPVMVTLLVIGLIWVVVYYISSGELPIGALGDWNLVAGLAFVAAGCVLSTKWE